VFRLLARLFADPTLTRLGVTSQPETVFATHPLQLSRWLEQVFAGGGLVNWPTIGTATAPLGDPQIVQRIQLPLGLLNDDLQSGIRPVNSPGTPPIFDPDPPQALGVDLLPLPWDHLVYAYLTESTGIVPVFAEVIRRYSVGETLDAPSVQTVAWARATEELFFRDPPLFNVGGVVSQLRPDAAVNRRNAYWRMFGWDLPHPGLEGQPWKRDVGPTANTRFLELWNELLRQVWLAIENERNAVGANPTDATYIGYLCQTLGEMMRLRRRGGMLTREEFSYVTMLTWFHLTVESDTPVVQDLRATAGLGGNAADRLAAIAARVGIAIPRQTRELFDLADLMSPVLWFIELDRFSSAANAETLFKSTGTVNPVARDMLRLIDLWQSATGQRVKDLAVTVRSAPGIGAGSMGAPAIGAASMAQTSPLIAAQPTRLPAGPPIASVPATTMPVPQPASVSGNGNRPRS
jgi:hypothetical protein